MIFFCKHWYWEFHIWFGLTNKNYSWYSNFKMCNTRHCIIIKRAETLILPVYYKFLSLNWDLPHLMVKHISFFLHTMKPIHLIKASPLGKPKHKCKHKKAIHYNDHIMHFWGHNLQLCKSLIYIMGCFMFCLPLLNKFPKGYNKAVLYHININPVHIYGNVSNCYVCLLRT